MQVISKQTLGRALATLAADTLTFGNTTNMAVGLYKNDVNILNVNTTSDLESANFPGYSPAELGSQAVPIVNPLTGEKGLAFNGNLLFVCSDTVSANQTIYGWYLSGSESSDDILYICRFDVPVEISGIGQFVEFAVNLFASQLTFLH